MRRGVSMHAFVTASDGALFLTALLCMFTFLREAASHSRDVARAGAFLTGQPPGRRYVAMCFPASDRGYDPRGLILSHGPSPPLAGR